jgi:DHA3 family macrolide efflux protein-like MFS transporter
MADSEDQAGPRPNGRRHAIYRPLLANRDFRLLWIAQVVSTIGTYTYSLAVATSLTGRMSGSRLADATAVVLGVQAGAAAVSGLLLAGPIADRFNRRRVMIGSDLVRFAAVSTLLLGSPSLPHLALVAAILGAAGALFDPSMAASLPNVVEDRQVVAANAAIGGTFYASAMIGPAVGAGLVALFGLRMAFTLNALSFVASAMLLTAARFRRPVEPRHERTTPLALARDLRDGARQLLRSRIAVAIGMTMVLAIGVFGAQGTLQIVFVRDVLAPGGGLMSARAAILATLTTAWGSGMLVGSLGSPLLIDRIPRERLIPLSIVGVGGCVIAGGACTSLTPIVVLWFVAGVMSGLTNISYESLLQERTPDEFRGRIIATVEAAQEATYVLGIAGAAMLAKSTPIASGLQLVGFGFVLAGVAASFLLRWASAAGRADVPVPAGSEP